MIELSFLLNRLETELPRYAFRFKDEIQLHEGIAMVLTNIGVPFVREKVATPKDRFDFWVDERIVIEAKIDGSFAEAVRQADRYAALPEVQAVVLVASTSWSKRLKPKGKLHKKPIRFITVRRQSF